MFDKVKVLRLDTRIVGIVLAVMAMCPKSTGQEGGGTIVHPTGLPVAASE